MSVNTYIRDYALRNIWCTPDQDMQVVIEPARITPAYGFRKTVSIGWRLEPLPNDESTFHVFSAGSLNPLLIGLFPAYRRWNPLCENMNKHNMIAECYNTKGVMIPRHRVWYHVTEDGFLIFAVEQPLRNAIKFDYGNDRVFFRVYTNAFFESQRSHGIGALIKVRSRQAKNRAEIVEIQTEVEAIKADGKDFQLFCYINGRLVPEITLLNTKVMDEIEYVLDSTIKGRYEFKLNELREFNSKLDGVSKYLIHPEQRGLPFSDQIIDYYDDTETYLIYPKGDTYDGVKLHRNDPVFMRNVTHRDYSLSVAVVQAAHVAQGWTNPQECKVVLHVRHSGYDRKLVYEGNYIRELYRLPEDRVLRAMLGIDSNVACWQAAELENNAYTEVMRSKSRDITPVMAENAIGYYASTQLIAKTPQKVGKISGIDGVWTPMALKQESTFYEYDKDGLLLGFHLHNDRELYTTRDLRTKLLDARVGYGSMMLDEVYGEPITLLKPGVDYRFYVCDIYDGVPHNNWEDVTGTQAYFIANGRVNWTTGPNKYTLVRGNGAHLAYSFETDMFQGYPPTENLPYGDTYCFPFSFALKQQSYQFGVIMTHNLRIPLGELSIWLNGHYLVEGVDYIVKDSVVHLLNTKYLNYPLTTKKQSFTVRATGFNGSGTYSPQRREVGWVEQGVLSRNKRFNIREGHSVHISAGGAIYHPDDLRFSEDHPDLNHLDASNGLPYEISEIVIPTKTFTVEDTYDFREKAVVNVNMVEDYLTERLPDPDADSPNTILTLYLVSSPFFNKVIYDITQGVFDNEPRIFEAISEQEVREILRPYEHLLLVDPVTLANRLDPNYVEIIPHNGPAEIAVSMHMFRFLQLAVNAYGNGLVKLNNYVTVRPII